MGVVSSSDKRVQPEALDLPGPARRIRVEPLRRPDPAPQPRIPEPAPTPEPQPRREEPVPQPKEPTPA